MPIQFEKIVLVTRRTRLEELVQRFNTRAQARFYIEHSGGSFELYEREHETYQQALAVLRQTLQKTLKLQEIERAFLPNFLFMETDIAVTLGVDGLVVNTAKYLSGQPLLAFNPDPEHIDGILLPFRVKDAPGALRRLLAGQASIRQVSMAEAFLNDGQALLAFNDLFIGIQSHASARYHIRAGDRDEEQSSSGIIVSTGAGATGWLSSLFNMAEGMWTAFGGAPAELPRLSLSWEADRLVFVVREPFASKTSSARLVCGVITPESPLLLESHMPDSGLIFSDGVQNDFLAFNAGARATIRLAEKKTCLVVQK